MVRPLALRRISFFQRLVVFVLEFARIKFGLLRLENVRGEIDHVLAGSLATARRKNSLSRRGLS